MNNLSPEQVKELDRRFEKKRLEDKAYCDSLIGKTRDEATKINMSHGFHTEAFKKYDVMTLDSRPNRVNLYVDDNNVVYKASKG